MRIQNTVIAAAAALSLSAGAAGTSHLYAQHAQGSMRVKVVATESKGHYVFSLHKQTVARGAKVTWVNKSDAPHTVTFDTGATFDKQLGASGKVSFTFTKAGVYKYHCTYHSGMTGTIVVK